MSGRLDTLLEKEGITLEQILEEDILNEIKGIGSSKFAKFVLKDPQVYVKMIEYISLYDREEDA